MAVVFPIGVEVYANCPACVATSTYGTTNPAAGTTESWVMGTGSTTFPVANFNASTTFTNPSATPPGTYFYIRDPADTTNEIILVYAGGNSTTTWYVQRGMNGATVAHASGATYVQVISPFTLGAFKQASGAGTSAVTAGSTTNEIVLASYTPVTADLNAGVSYDVIAFGPITTQHTAAATLQFSVYWGGSGSIGGTFTTTGSALLARLLTNTNCPALPSTVIAGASFDLTGDIVWLTSTTAHGNLNAWYTNANSATTVPAVATVTNSSSSTPYNSQSGPVTISGSGPIFLTAKWSSTTPSLTAVAPIIRRAV